MNFVKIKNVPPRTKVPKILYLGTNEADGNFTLTIHGGWSEYKREDVEKIRDACQQYLDSLMPWQCPNCHNENEAVPRESTYGYTWVRCRHCFKKFERDRLDLNPRTEEVAQHI